MDGDGCGVTIGMYSCSSVGAGIGGGDLMGDITLGSGGGDSGGGGGGTSSSTSTGQSSDEAAAVCDR